MTCIVGCEHKGAVYIGGDSAGTASNMHQRVRKDKKVFIKGEFIIGFCGSFRMGDLLKHTMKLPKPQKGGDDVAYMVNDFVDALRACLEKENENLQGDDKLFPAILVGYRGKLFSIEGDYQVGQPEAGFDATGAGADIAIGAMHASEGSWKGPERRIRQALEASALNNASVRPPFVILKLPKKGIVKL